MACSALARTTMSYIFYCPSMKNATKNLLHRTALVLSHDSHLHSDNAKQPLYSRSSDYPLPGNVGVDLKELERYEERGASSLLMERDHDAQRAEVLMQYLHSITDVPHTESHVGENNVDCEVNAVDRRVERKIEACPPSLKKDFQRLFDKTDREESLTVLTISQHTDNDMTMWSDEVEEEREALIHTFVETATEIVGQMTERGYWADFIDPCSGSPFNGSHKNETLFETDDRFNQLGFRIEDLGCCKAIAHKEWGTNVFVGVLFTSAPLEVFSDVSDVAAANE